MSVDGGRLAHRIKELYANDAQIQAARPDDAVHAAVTSPGLPLARIVATAMTGYAERPALGARRTELARDPVTGRATRRLLPEFELLSYGEAWERARALAAAWHADGFGAGDFVTMLGFTGVDYTVLDLAAIHLGAVAVPLQSGAGLAQLRSILDETAPRIFAVDTAHLGIAVDAILAGATPRTLVVFDHHTDDDDHRDALAAARTRLGVAGSGVVLHTLTDLVDHGRHAPAAPLSEPAEGEDPLALLIYTSGSTGTPKGAMYTQRLVAVGWQPPRPLAAINVNFLPMSHIAARLTLNSALARGGTAYFAAAPDMSTLFEDITLVRPTEIFLVPRVCDLIQQRFRHEVEQRGGVDSEALAEQVRTELREQFLGGRLLSVLCGSAPIAPDLRVFVESVLQLRLHDGYGSTETGGGVIFDTKVMRPPVLDYKLVDVPELGYFGTDKPYPRGELLLKTTTMIAGYYRRPEVTAEVFDADGFCRTGDVVAELAPDRLAYVDRRNNVLKLSQGEFVTVSRLEAIYAGADLVHQIYVYGSSERAYLLAVVVPTAAALALPAAERRGAVRASLHRAATVAELESFEIPRDFLLEPEPFTVANGLLSGVGKLLRPKLKQHYGERLEELYAEVARDQDDELQRLRRDAPGLSVYETVARAARAVLGCAAEDLRPDARLADLGGDSLAALSYSTLLRELLAVEVPVNVLLGPDSDLARIADYIRLEREPGSRRIDVDAVHGAGATEIRATDLVLEKFLDATTLAAAAELPAVTTVNTVLITGANGYLGRFLLLSWLERLAPHGGTVICVVRGADAAAARARLDAAFATDDELSEEFRLLAKQALEVLPGDIGEPELGLPQPVWRRLADQVDLIVHSAALVNHVLPYPQLFGPNVVGTAEVLRLALTAKRKPVSYLSTVAVAAQGESFAEDGDVRVMSPVRRIDESYANGYGNSKWAGEVLLREAAQRFGLPVAVFRSDMILAHSRYRGQLNVPDVFTRLLLSVLVTGLAPKSFYRTGSDGERQRAHYDGLPADFVAAAITELGAAATSGYRTHDVLNPHDDGISLDVLVDWLIAAGHRIDRIDDYDDWFARLDAALRALPDRQRKHTLLPLLHAYRRPGRALPGSALPAEGFRAAVRAARIGADRDIPHLGPELIDKYVRDLTELGLIDP
ncbi:carboxylic acid reductase [Nocardia sp. NPDC058176]|uniref:carboxylic acid reductase n=1 Tax=Nocardia sp. NPDC058176 TaxID=3346368 RepID=UPI0036D90D54